MVESTVRPILPPLLPPSLPLPLPCVPSSVLPHSLSSPSLPSPSPSLLPHSIMTAKEWVKYVQDPHAYVAPLPGCEGNALVGQERFRPSLTSTSTSNSTSTSTSTSTLASMVCESENTDLVLSENNAPVKTTETELKMVIGTETEIKNTDLPSGGDIKCVGEHADNGDSIEGRESRDRRGDGSGYKGVVGEEQGGGGGGGTIVQFNENPLPAHTGIGNNNNNANAKPFLADIMKKKFQLSQKKGIEENQINSGNTEYSVNGKGVSVIVDEDFADRKVRDVLTVTHGIAYHIIA